MTPRTFINYSDIERCPKRSLLARHYREDGTCRCVPTACRWFILCDNEAIGLLPHPVLGLVPICQRCCDRIEQTNALLPACLSCDGTLTYGGSYGAPGIGQAWECDACGAEHSKVGGRFSLASDMAHIMSADDAR